MNYTFNFAPMTDGPTEATDDEITIRGNENLNTSTGANGETPQSEGSPGGFFTPMTLLLWGGVIVLMWFMLIRPQRKREREVREMQSALKVGDPIITTSGFFGKIVGTGTDAFLIEFGENRGLKIWVRKSDIAGIKSPSTTSVREDSSAE